MKDHVCQLPPVTAELILEPAWPNRRWDCACGMRWVVMKMFRSVKLNGVLDLRKSGVWTQLPTDQPERTAMREVLRAHMGPWTSAPSNFDDGLWLPVDAAAGS